MAAVVGVRGSGRNVLEAKPAPRRADRRRSIGGRRPSKTGLSRSCIVRYYYSLVLGEIKDGLASYIIPVRTAYHQASLYV